MTLSRWTSTALVAAGSAAAMGVLIGGDIGRGFDVLALLLLGTLPALRVAVLSVSWARARDLKFAVAAVTLLVLMAVGTLTVVVLK